MALRTNKLRQCNRLSALDHALTSSNRTSQVILAAVQKTMAQFGTKKVTAVGHSLGALHRASSFPYMPPTYCCGTYQAQASRSSRPSSSGFTSLTQQCDSWGMGARECVRPVAESLSVSNADACGSVGWRQCIRKLGGPVGHPGQPHREQERHRDDPSTPLAARFVPPHQR